MWGLSMGGNIRCGGYQWEGMFSLFLVRFVQGTQPFQVAAEMAVHWSGLMMVMGGNIRCGGINGREY